MSLADPSSGLPSAFIIFAFVFWILEKGLIVGILIYLYKIHGMIKKRRNRII
ncbi:hypothetical protein DES36_106155 [Alkalibaculum bacchi]|uniref:Uncharacterized protein n=1 Tax=Alkalibaculum bacchi TaxID=645887 RepID=A0A366IC25_9FIRM|nr:hypothetical protein [Alkalibaculum bacchi]RBP66042.1 hypothetical protein DES36_106155 [Alkalibaculum bacchi]